MLSENEAVKFKNKLRLWRIMHPRQGRGCKVCSRLKKMGEMYCGNWYENKLRENMKTGEIIEVHTPDMSKTDLRCIEFIRYL